MPVLTIVDCTAIQRYVFLTNRLKDAVGGSALVAQLSEWLRPACAGGDIIMAAGGSAMARFASHALAMDAMTRLSRMVIDEAPGLELVVHHEQYEMGKLASAARRAQVALQAAKSERAPSVPLLGVSITASCLETRLPAAGFDEEGRPVSHEVLRRRRVPGVTIPWLKDLLDALKARYPRAPEFMLPRELDQLGRSEGIRSLMGVVHVDGNAVGRCIADWLAVQETDDDTLIAQYRQMSTALDRLSHDAFRTAAARAIGAIAFDDDTQRYVVKSPTTDLRFALSDVMEGHRRVGIALPFLPLVLGGDDLTFVCDGRIALDLAATTLEAFESAELPVLGTLTACAGVAITRTHTPILRAYMLAAELCDSAKKLRRTDSTIRSAIDWHIGTASPTETIETLRDRQYGADHQIGVNRLTMRPYALRGQSTDPTWQWLAGTVLGGNESGFRGNAWAARRSKIKDLRALAREGPDFVHKATTAWAVNAPGGLGLPPLLGTTGFMGTRTALLDAIELLDIHLPLA